MAEQGASTTVGTVVQRDVDDLNNPRMFCFPQSSIMSITALGKRGVDKTEM